MADGEENSNKQAMEVDPVEVEEKMREEPLESPNLEKLPALRVTKEGELSEEDKLLKEKLEELVASVLAQNQDSAKSLDQLKVEIQTSTSSLTAIPKPLKFLLPLVPSLVAKFDGANKTYADLLSVLSMIKTQDCLKYKLLGNRRDIASWGPEYVRALSGDLIATVDGSAGDVEEMVEIIVQYQLDHQMDYEAVDLCFDCSLLGKLVEKATEDNFERMAHYLVRLADFAGQEERREVSKVAFDLFLRFKECVDALRVALRVGERDWVRLAFRTAKENERAAAPRSLLMRRQMASVMASHRQFWLVDSQDEHDLQSIMSNSRLSDLFRRIGRELNVEEAKSPEEVYKSSLSETNTLIRRENASAPQVESARQNLAAVFVNAFVNCAFQRDELITPEGNPFVYRNKDTGMISAVASLGLLLLWDVDEGMSQIDRFLYSTDRNIKAGALLALGMVGCGVSDDCDPALGMLPSYLQMPSTSYAEERMCASLGLGLAYCGNPKPEVFDALNEVIEQDTNFDSVCMAALSLGFAFCGTGSSSQSESLVQKLTALSEDESRKPSSKFLALGLALLYLGKGEECDLVLEMMGTLPHVPLAKFARVLISGCAYAGSGNMQEVQKMLHACCSDREGASAAQPKEGEDPVDRSAEAHEQLMYQSAATIGIALITLGESVSIGMADRMYTHLLQYGDLSVRRAVPLALALSFASNPDYNTVDVIARLTHDPDQETSWCAILSLGLVGAGTNNSRVAGLLRLLATFYAKDGNSLFVVRLAQGLLHSGKGLVSLSPLHSDNSLLLHSSLCGLLTLLVASLDMKTSVLGKMHFLLFAVTPAIRPRVVIAVQPHDLQPVTGVNLRVGKSVDVVGQAGKPKTITGFQTHVSPSLLSSGERSEFAEPERYVCAARVLEGVVFVEKVPDQDEEKA